MNKYLVIGLGNIGEEYNYTRHNIGFDCADVLAAKHGGIFKLDRQAYIAQIKLKNKQVTIIKPTTYMNLSGKAFKYWMDKENIAIENTITVVDDLALPIETLRIKGRGTDAGHNGLKNIQEVLGTDAYPKLRFGIGSNFSKGAQVNFVLGRWTDTELPIVKAKLMLSVEAIESFVLAGLANTMNAFNNKQIKLEN
jgi:peptidyl-tRNA hydrolase, PTH1 family